MSVFNTVKSLKYLLPPITNYQLPITNHQSPITNHQLPITNHQSPITNYQSPITNYHQPETEKFLGVSLVPLRSFARSPC
ncbi:MAG TPA: hypothetical protein DDZ80_16470 [Cyanobacteria bacterium UBA8803]|nr:hypothetical protein [Cyanobacteria bacterium UBA8803]